MWYDLYTSSLLPTTLFYIGFYTFSGLFFNHSNFPFNFLDTMSFWCRSHASYCQHCFRFSCGVKHWKMPGLLQLCSVGRLCWMLHGWWTVRLICTVIIHTISKYKSKMRFLIDINRIWCQTNERKNSYCGMVFVHIVQLKWPWLEQNVTMNALSLK